MKSRGPGFAPRPGQPLFKNWGATFYHGKSYVHINFDLICVGWAPDWAIFHKLTVSVLNLNGYAIKDLST
jgi:hypothetical protein